MEDHFFALCMWRILCTLCWCSCIYMKLCCATLVNELTLFNVDTAERNKLSHDCAFRSVLQGTEKAPRVQAENSQINGMSIKLSEV